MYNAENKERFIHERESTTIIPVGYLRRAFDAIGFMEEKLNKDLCNFNIYDIKEYYKFLNTPCLETLLVLTSHLSMYTQWCIQQNLVKDNQNHYRELNRDDLLECVNITSINKSIFTIEEIYEVINTLINARDQFVILGLFEGMSGKSYSELINLDPNDIVGNEAILCTGRKIKLSNKLLSIINDCVETDVLYAAAITKNGVQREFPLIDRGYVFKDLCNVRNDNERSRGIRVQATVARCMKYFDDNFKVKPNDIITSGKIHMINKRAKELGMTAYEFLYSEYYKEVEEQYGDKLISKIAFYKKYENYLV